MLLRNDGKHKIYQVEYLYADDKWTQTKGIPKNCNSDLHDAVWNNFVWWEKHNLMGDGFDIYKEFTASGECWQLTGIEGTFNKASALALLNHLVLSNPDKKFRLIEIEVLQETKVILKSE